MGTNVVQMNDKKGKGAMYNGPDSTIWNGVQRWKARRTNRKGGFEKINARPIKITSVVQSGSVTYCQAVRCYRQPRLIPASPIPSNMPYSLGKRVLYVWRPLFSCVSCPDEAVSGAGADADHVQQLY
jgi:hypothetical protein